MFKNIVFRLPIPLFSDTPVNNNNTYSYDALEDQPETPHSAVFMPTTTMASPVATFSRNTIELLQQPTFYKSLITVMNTKWSSFVFFALYPSFLLQVSFYPIQYNVQICH